MKEELINYVNARINWATREQQRLRKEDRADEAAHAQISVNVYNIFLSTYRAMKYDLAETLARFSSIVDTWNENHRKAYEHNDLEKTMIEEIKISRALDIIERAKELELTQHD